LAGRGGGGERGADMELDVCESLKTDADPALVWKRMLDASAVSGFLGGDPTDLCPLDHADHPGSAGHTFRIKGVGGGLFHARIDRREEHGLVSYLVWNDEMPDTPFLLAYAIDASARPALLTAQVTMEMPLEGILGSFKILGHILQPFAPDVARWYTARQLRKQLTAMSASAGPDARA